MTVRRDRFKARGHPNITATHKSTLEITRESNLTLRGDCVIAVEAKKTCSDLSEGFKKVLRSNDSRLTIKLECGKIVDEVYARGDERLTLSSSNSMVVRRSFHICGRTLAVEANKAAVDLSKDLIKALRCGSDLIIQLEVES